LTALNSEFLHNREQIFRTTLQKLQAELTALHEGGNQDFIDQVTILEDARDRELVQIEAGRGYALLRAEREYQDEIRRAEEEYIVSRPQRQPLTCRHKNGRQRRIYCMNSCQRENDSKATRSYLTWPLTGLY
jgi:hypothetical protein